MTACPLPAQGAARARRGRRAFLGLGSNLGDRRALLRDAVAGLPDVVAISPVYETDPVGGPPGQPPYLNIVVELCTDRDPRALLDLARDLEAVAGRVRTELDGPRTLDVDVLLVDDLRVDEPDLVVPHPRMGDRRFVLAPLADIAPDKVPAEWEQQATGNIRRVGTL
ncbi:MAG: 2-amino-4-hydroxy-6-hydroxymethyldihydropteridine diphosphokinase [Acidimicrobiales bacterium]